MKIRELMTQQVETCSMNDTLQRAASIMSDLDVGIVPIVRDDKYLEGVVTDRDIVIRAVAKGLDMNRTKVSECMSENVVVCSPETTVDEASRMMADNQVRRLPVVEESKLVGIIAIGDLATGNTSEDEAGFALSEISEPSRPEVQH